jgi:hypothetical protein
MNEITTYYGGQIFYECNGHGVTQELMWQQLMNEGYHLLLVTGFYPSGGLLVSSSGYVATKNPQQKIEYLASELDEYEKLIVNNHPPFIYFAENGLWTYAKNYIHLKPNPAPITHSISMDKEEILKALRSCR